HLQVEEDRARRGRQLQGDRRSHPPRRHQGGRAGRLRRDAAHRGPDGEDPRGRPRDDEDQSQGLWHQLEQGDGQRRPDRGGRRRGRDGRGGEAAGSRGAGSGDRTPILVGAGQLTQREVRPAEALEPLAMMEEVARRAADDARAGAALLARIDSLAVVNVFCWPYANPPRLLAERLGIQPAEELYTTVGGSTPQWLVDETAARV